MHYKKKGIPEKGELVICKVRKILPHSVFVSLEEYENEEGMLHVSEISPKWVKNIKDHVDINNEMVCKVLNVDEKKHFIDVSLRKVSPGEKKSKMEEFKTENKMEKLLEFAAKKLGKPAEKAFSEVGDLIFNKYSYLSALVDEYRELGVKFLKDLRIPKEWVSVLENLLEEQIKVSRVKLGRNLKINSFESDGIERIKSLLNELIKSGRKKNLDIKVTYISAPDYKCVIEADDFKTGENDFFEVIDQIKKTGEELGVVLEVNK